MTEKTKYIERLKYLYLQKTGKTLSEKEALECFEKLVVLVKRIYQPITKQKI